VLVGLGAIAGRLLDGHERFLRKLRRAEITPVEAVREGDFAKIVGAVRVDMRETKHRPLADLPRIQHGDR